MAKEKESMTGRDQATDRQAAEYDLVTALLSAANYRDDITDFEIRRNGVYYFTVHIHPISQDEARQARKQATPTKKKRDGTLPEPNSTIFNSKIIYAATTEEDRQKIWGQSAVMQKFGLMEPYESIDILLTMGEKSRLLDEVMNISGMNEDDVDDETFQS